MYVGVGEEQPMNRSPIQMRRGGGGKRRYGRHGRRLLLEFAERKPATETRRDVLWGPLRRTLRPVRPIEAEDQPRGLLQRQRRTGTIICRYFNSDEEKQNRLTNWRTVGQEVCDSTSFGPSVSVHM